MDKNIKPFLLLNGCSFTDNWKPSKDFTDFLGCEHRWTVNIGKPATGFQRTLRSTIEWIAQRGDPEFMIIPITFAHRWELAISEKDDKLDGTWQPLQMAEMMPKDLNSLWQKIDPDVDHDKLRKLLELYYGIIPNIRTYWDKTFAEIIALCAFLEQRNIKYLMFDMCNDFKTDLIDNFEGFAKVQLIKANNRIIDIFNFCGNKYMWQSMTNKSEDFNIHHAPPEYLVLEAHLKGYITRNKLLQ
jgi:hypothetical protein